MDNAVDLNIEDSKKGAESNLENPKINPVEQAAIDAAKKEQRQLRTKEKEDKKFAEVYSEFRSEQDKIIQRAEQSIPKNCPSCQIVIH